MADDEERHATLDEVLEQLRREYPYPRPFQRPPDPEDGQREPKAQERTLDNLQRLREIRRDSIRDGRVQITRLEACKRAGIDRKTVKIHDPTLWEHWYDHQKWESGNSVGNSHHDRTHVV